MKLKWTLIVLSAVLILPEGHCQTNADYLNMILQKVDEIKTACYQSKSSFSAPHDTLAFHTYKKHVNMYINPEDTFLGASYSTANLEDPAKLDFCYDGKYAVQLDWEDKTTEIDTLQGKLYGRPMPPFFISARSLLEYSLHHIDSSIIKINAYADSTRIAFRFVGKSVEFWGTTPIVEESSEIISRYELWVDENNFPYKYIRRMPHQTSWEIISDFKVSDQLDYEFNALHQIPVDFEIKGVENRKITTSELEGQVASDWTLKEAHGDSISLGELRSKVVLIQFTGIGCGPCHASIPFLEQLVNENKNLELVSVETWSDNIAGIERYKDKNDLNYKFLVATPKVKDQYKVQGVPSFFILDEDKVIRKVIVGYQKEITDNQIREYIAELMD